MKLGSKSKQAELWVEGYKLYRSDRKRAKSSKRGRDSGGVAFYIRNDIAQSTSILMQFSNGVVEALCLYSEKENLILACIYRQPDDSTNGHTSLNREFKEMLVSLKQCISGIGPLIPDIIIGGDFNLPRISWNDGVATFLQGCPKAIKELNHSLHDCCNDLFLKQVVEHATHKDGNVLDLILTNNTDLVHELNINDTLLSITHHKIIQVSTSYKTKCKLHKNRKVPPLTSLFQKFNFHSNTISWEDVACELNDYSWEAEFQEKTPDEMLKLLYDLCLEVAEKHVPKRNLNSVKKRKNNPMKQKLLRRRKKLNKMLTKVKSTSRRDHLQSELVDTEKRLMLMYRNSREYEEKMAVDAIKKNSKYFFKYAKKFSKVPNKVGPLKNDDGELIDDPSSIAEMLSNQYVKMFSEPSNLSEIVNNDGLSSSTVSLSDVTFDDSDTARCIDEIRDNAACGLDGFPAILLKKCKDALAKALTLIWKESFKTGQIPQILRRSVIAPIHKGGSRYLPPQYRPVALTSHLIKVFEKIIKKKMVDYLEGNQLFKPGQHGFRAGRSCLSQLLDHFEKVIDIISSGNNADVIYLDFSKAFDKVDFTILLHKMAKLGIGGKLLQWIKEFLTHREQCVCVSGFLSDFVKVLSGIPQGSVLGPILFLIMMIDIDVNVKHATVKSFADDTRAMHSIHEQNDMVDLQHDVESIYNWADANNLKFNDTKFELVQYGACSDLKTSYQYETSEHSAIQPSECVKDLGVLMSNDCTFTKHINAVIEDAKSRASWALRTFSSRNPTAMLTLWKSLILPKLEYCSQLWCPVKKGTILQLEEVQRSFVRKIRFENSFNMDYWQRLQFLNMYSLERRRERYRILYVWKIIEGLVPNISNSINSGIQIKHNARVGRTCIIPNVSSRINNGVRKLYDGLLSQHGSKLYNCLPKHLRDISGCSVNSFKNKLDAFLLSVPDEPIIPGYTGGNGSIYGSNSLINVLSRQ